MITYNFFKNWYLNHKYTKLLKKIYKNESLLPNLSQLFNAEFQMDWVGRVYTVLNPNLVDKKLDTNTQVYEYDEKGLNNSAYIEKWVMDRLLIAQQFIQANNLFDLLTYEIKKLDDYENYLLVIEPITFKPFVESLRKFANMILILGGVVGVGFVINNIWHFI